MKTMGKDGFRYFLHCSLEIYFHSLSTKSIIICFDLKHYQRSVFFPCSLCTVKAVSPSILLQPVTNKSAKTREWTICCLRGRALLVSCLCKNFPKGVSFIMHPKRQISQRFLQSKLWNNTPSRVPTETELPAVYFLTRFYPEAHVLDYEV